MTNQPMIQCPNCGHQFALDAAFQEHFEEEKRRAVSQAVENARQKAEVEYKRQLTEERAAMREQIELKLNAEYDLKLREKDEQIATIKRQAEELKRKAEQGSQQLQGEALEGRLLDLLQHEFPSDEINEVKRGVQGADIVQIVYNRYGQQCGTIIWEAKNTKVWNKDWIEKLKQDKSRSGADIMALVSVALPEEIPLFAQKDGVWVSAYSCAVPMACALRETLMQVGHLRRAMNGQGDKMNEIYAYLISPDFKYHVERIVGAFVSMDEEIDRERRAMDRIWKTRREHLQHVIGATEDMYATFAAIVGKDMPQIEALELQALPAGDD